MGFRVNFSDVESKSFDPVPAGTYHVKITDGELKETSGGGKLPGGTPMINWEFTIQNGPYEGRRLWTNTVIHERTLFNLKALLEASGRFNEAQLSGGDIDFEIDDLIGADLKIVVAQREYNGDTVNDVKRFKKISAEEVETNTSLLP